MNVFTDTFYLLADLFQNNIFQNVLSRMSNPLKDIFHSVYVWYDEAILVWFLFVNIMGFDENLKMGFSQND